MKGLTMNKKIKPEQITKAREYALNGFTHRQIAKSLGISHSTLYANSDIMDTIRKAEDDLREKIANDIIHSSSKGEVSVQIFLTKRLNLFSVSYKMPQIKSISSALTQLARINADLASGELPIELANNLIKNIELFMKAYEIHELEERITILEKRHG